jgi:tetratricopeptide (TPR) repeat protein
MRLVARIAVVAAVAAFCVYAFRVWVYQPYACVVMVTDLRNRTATMLTMKDDVAATAMARENLTDLYALRDRCPTEPRAYTMMAATLDRLGRYDEIIPVMQDALKIDRRPEFYIAIADADVRLGKTKDAAENYLTAARFRSNAIEAIQSEEIMRRVQERLHARH